MNINNCSKRERSNSDDIGEVNGAAPINTLPRDAFRLVLSWIDHVGLLQCARVNKTWNHHATQILIQQCNMKFPKRIFGKEEWLQYAGDPGEVPEPTNSARAALLSCKDPANPPLLYWIPSQVDGKPWNLSALEEHAQKSYSCKVYPRAISFDLGFTPHGIKETTVDKGCWVLMDTTVTDFEEDEFYIDFEARMRQIGKKLPSPLIAATIIHTQVEFFKNALNILPDTEYFLLCRNPKKHYRPYYYYVGNLTPNYGNSFGITIDNNIEDMQIRAALIRKF